MLETLQSDISEWLWENFFSFPWGSLRDGPFKMPLLEVTQLSHIFFHINLSHRLGRVAEFSSAIKSQAIQLSILLATIYPANEYLLCARNCACQWGWAQVWHMVPMLELSVCLWKPINAQLWFYVVDIIRSIWKFKKTFLSTGRVNKRWRFLVQLGCWKVGLEDWVRQWELW